MEAKTFALLDKWYGGVSVYFCETQTKRGCLVAIPLWNWCFLMDYGIHLDDERPRLIEALSVPMSGSDAEEFAEVLYDYVLNQMH
ncbi:hypothetical protein [Brevibacillus nitrificans]|uniref:hypothetical protein n=1 Tax=Brevibacillus nitrificans TaxID=651560 RepID=UPI001E53FBD5|nr:hypothetical protein [Brevibacillus nitrificans]MDR7319652.1 hypothetical protein [Brevibacillus nitrificans]